MKVGTEQPVGLLRHLAVLADYIGTKSIMVMLSQQACNAPGTEADVSALNENMAYAPGLSMAKRVGDFVRWYRTYYDDTAKSSQGVKRL